MNCQSCNAHIDYRFLTSCVYCGVKVEPSGVPQIDPFPEPLLSKRRVWNATLVNIVYALVSSIAGLMTGVVTAYALVVVVYSAVFSGSSNPHEGCGGWGMALGMLSIVAGAYLGTVGGTVLAVKRPLCNVSAK